jgi:hypothetical protein
MSPPCWTVSTRSGSAVQSLDNRLALCGYTLLVETIRHPAEMFWARAPSTEAFRMLFKFSTNVLNATSLPLLL